MADKVERWLMDKLKEPWSSSKFVHLCSGAMLEGIRPHIENIDQNVILRVLMVWLHLPPRQTKELMEPFNQILQDCIELETDSKLDWRKAIASLMKEIVSMGKNPFSLETADDFSLLSTEQINQLLESKPFHLLPSGYELLDPSLLPFSEDTSVSTTQHFTVSNPVSFDLPTDSEPQPSSKAQQTHSPRPMTSSRPLQQPSFRPLNPSTMRAFHPGMPTSISAASSILSRTKHNLSAKKTGVMRLDPQQIADVRQKHKNTRVSDPEMERRRKEREETKRKEREEREEKKAVEREAKRLKKEEEKEAKRRAKELEMEKRMNEKALVESKRKAKASAIPPQTTTSAPPQTTTAPPPNTTVYAQPVLASTVFTDQQQPQHHHHQQQPQHHHHQQQPQYYQQQQQQFPIPAPVSQPSAMEPIPVKVQQQLSAILEGANRVSDVDRELIQRFLQGVSIPEATSKNGKVRVVLSENEVTVSDGSTRKETILFEMDCTEGSWRKLKKVSKK